MKIMKMLLLAAVSSSISFAYSVIHSPQTIFEKWIKIQHIVHDRDLTDLWPSLDDNYLMRFKKNYEENLPLLRSLQPLLSHITNGAINENGYIFQPPMSIGMHDKIATLLSTLENNPSKFIDFLHEIKFTDKSETKEKSADFNFTVDKYKALTKLLISAKTPRQEEEYSIALANRLVEYCYESNTFPHYQATLQRAESHSTARMLHTIIWYNIIGNGWKLWHDSCIQNLKSAADEGKRIKYIAGGNDIYTLLSQGIYNITIIDPFLPSQTRYYSNGWEWLISGTINDEIIGMFGSRELRLVRTSQIEGEPFMAKAANQVVTLRKFTTTWTVYDAEESTQLGTVILDRRFVQKNDIIPDSENVFLMSYDEFIYLGLPASLDGWGITPNSVDSNFTCYIKQLRKPFNRDNLNNLRIASITNHTDLKFINLASDAN